jgi:hypothetical protein
VKLAAGEPRFSEPEPKQLSASVVSYVALPRVQPLADPSSPGLVSRFQLLLVRHLHEPFPSQNLLLPQEVVLSALLPPPQLPFAWQLSPTIHTLPSSQLPLFTAGAGQPLAGTQLPAVWHWSAPVQETAAPPPQTPFDWHVSPVVQALLSLQLPVFTTGAGQPLAGTHAPTVWH